MSQWQSPIGLGWFITKYHQNPPQLPGKILPRQNVAILGITFQPALKRVASIGLLCSWADCSKMNVLHVIGSMLLVSELPKKAMKHLTDSMPFCKCEEEHAKFITNKFELSFF